jgi:hypothetical protein
MNYQTIDNILDYYKEELVKDQELVDKLNELKNEIIGYIRIFNIKMKKKEGDSGNSEIDIFERKRIDENPKFYEIKNVYLLNYKGKEVLLFLYSKIGKLGKSSKEQVYCIVEYENWRYEIKGWNLKRNSLIKWTDSIDKNNNKIFKRQIKPYSLYLNLFNGEIDYLERYYDFSEIVLANKEEKFNEKYGVLDLETLVVYNKEENLDNINIEDLGLGNLNVYAGGWKIRGTALEKLF